MILFLAFWGYESNNHRLQNFDRTVKQCMGIPIITEEKFNKIACYLTELDNIVCLEGKLLPYEKKEKCLYVSRNIGKEPDYKKIVGELKGNYPGYQLFFLEDTAFQNMSESVKNGHKFTLVAVNKKGNYMAYSLVFTTLPIIELHGKTVDRDERDREIHFGEINVWEPVDESSMKESVTTVRLEWKKRGNTAMLFPKQSLKLSLKNKNNQKKNVSLLAMESDDDYILNPMWFDDLKVREKLAISLWNEIAEENHSDLKMSEAEYCELLIDGEYQGIYLLQKRIEKKALKLEDSALLLKGKSINPTEDDTSEDVFEIVYSKERPEDVYRIMDSFLYKTDFSNVDLNNWVDTQLFLQLGNMNDNRRYKNMYYVMSGDEGDRMLRFLPWDTDMSFGIAWADDFSYRPESVEEIYYRVEYEKITEQYPMLQKMLSERWASLRNSTFSEENILNTIDLYFNKVKNSGAMDRDLHKYEQNVWEGEDTLNNLKLYIKRRLNVLDELYRKVS